MVVLWKQWPVSSGYSKMYQPSREDTQSWRNEHVLISHVVKNASAVSNITNVQCKVQTKKWKNLTCNTFVNLNTCKLQYSSVLNDIHICMLVSRYLSVEICRYLGEQLPMTELNILYLHGQLVWKVNLTPTVTQSVRILKLHTVSSRLPRLPSVVPESNTGDEPALPVPGTSTDLPGDMSSGRKRKKKCSKKKGETENVPTPVSLVKANMRTVGTQTDKPDTQLENRDPITRTNILECRRKYMDENIKKQEFDSDIEGAS